MCGKANVRAMHVKRIGTDVNNDIVLFTLAARHVVQWRNCANLIAVHAWAWCMPNACDTKQEFVRSLSVIFFRRYLPSLLQMMDGQYRWRVQVFPKTGRCSW